MAAFSNRTARWMETEIMTAGNRAVECELGSLIAAASDWTEDEGELGDLVDGLVETGFVQISVG